MSDGGTTRTVLFLGDDACVLAEAGAAAARRGMVLLRCAAADDAMAALTRPDRTASHLLVEPGCAGGWMPELVALTAGEACSGTGLVVLGPAPGFPPQVSVVDRPDAGTIGGALDRTPLPAPAGLDDAALSDRIARGGLDVRFQPIVRMVDRTPAGFETLARLEVSGSGTLAPSAFMLQAERAGLTGTVTTAVAARAFAGLPAATLRDRGLFLALNVPLDVLLRADSMHALDRQREAAGLLASDVLIELTESQSVTDLAALAAAVGRWRLAGYRLAIDDVGPDVANHRAMLRLPFDAVKFDMDVVQASGQSAQALHYLCSTIEIGRRSGLTVIAEGIADEAAWERMAGLGVDQVQGFLVGRPLPPRAVPFWLRDWR